MSGRPPAPTYDWCSGGIPFARQANGLLCRGVVLKVKTHDDPDRLLPQGRTSPAVTASGFLCDVLVYSPVDVCTVLREVPISMPSAGLNDHEVWKPRPAGVDISPATFRISDPASVVASRAQNLDGDHVLVGFLDNDLQKPIIMGQIPHPRNSRKESQGDPTQYKYRRLIRGIDLGVTDGGSVVIDTTSASDGSISPTGDEVPAASAGDIDLTMKTGRLLQVIAQINPSPEPVVTDSLLGDLQLALTEVSTFMKAWGAPTLNLDTLIGKLPTLYRSTLVKVD